MSMPNGASEVLTLSALMAVVFTSLVSQCFIPKICHKKSTQNQLMVFGCVNWSFWQWVQKMLT